RPTFPHKDFGPLETLHALVAPVHLRLRPAEDGSLRRQYFAPSLLSSYAVMMFEDLERGSLRVCAACGEAFLTDASQQAYCRGGCMGRAKKRRLRDHQRKEADTLRKLAKALMRKKRLSYPAACERVCAAREVSDPVRRLLGIRMEG